MATVTMTVVIYDVPEGDEEAAAEKVARAFVEFPDMIEEIGLDQLVEDTPLTLYDGDGNERGQLNTRVELG